MCVCVCVCVYKVCLYREWLLIKWMRLLKVQYLVEHHTHTHTHTHNYTSHTHTHTHTHTQPYSTLYYCTGAQGRYTHCVCVCVCVCRLLVSLQYTYSSHQSGTFSVGTVGTEDVDCSTLDFTYVSLRVCVWCVGVGV